jgi:hypothetical protein
MMVHIESLDLKGMENNSNQSFRHIIVSTCDTTVLAIEHNQNLCADLTESHVDTSVEFCFKESLCALTDACNTSYTDKLHHVQSVTCGDFFARICLIGCFVILCLTCLSILIKYLRKFV